MKRYKLLIFLFDILHMKQIYIILFRDKAYMFAFQGWLRWSLNISRFMQVVRHQLEGDKVIVFGSVEHFKVKLSRIFFFIFSDLCHLHISMLLWHLFLDNFRWIN